MSIFARPHYTSDATQFIEQLKQQKPALDAQQQAGRALLWDKKIDLSEQQSLRESNEANRPYPYDVNFEKL